MRLAEFILMDMESILAEWEQFAAMQLPAAVSMDSLALRDHARQILEAVVTDIVLPQTAEAQRAKALGLGLTKIEASATAAQTHALLRSTSGFDINQLVAEYRALRASVLRLWAAHVAPADIDLKETIRFNEAIDQALAESIASFSNEVDVARRLFAGMLGHDMRTPLQAMLTTAAALKRLDAGSDVALAASRLDNSGNQLKSLIDDFLDFNRTQLGLAIEIEPSRVDLAPVFQDELDQQRAAKPGRKVVLDTTGDLTGTWDAKCLRRVLGNLVSNAFKYGTRNAPVFVTLDGEPSDIAFSVTNRGPEIDAVTLLHIFEPLRRGPPANGVETDPSLGLGLYICREIVAAHGGSIQAASKQSTTTFTVRLPRESAPPAAANPPPFRRRVPAWADDPLLLVQVAGRASVPDNRTGRLFRETTWSATPLGAVTHWPQSLRIAVSICLNSCFPMFVWWGPALVNIYNDAYLPMLGQHHPHAFGQPARSSWADIWEVLTPQINAVIHEGKASWNERVTLTVHRNGFPEHACFTWSYSPIYSEDGTVGGLFCAVTEDSARTSVDSAVALSHPAAQGTYPPPA